MHDDTGREPVAVDLDAVWVGVAAEVWSTPPGRAERLATRLLHSPGLARALVTTPSLVVSWLLASVAVLAIGVLATQASHEPWVGLLAPALAGVGVAYAYGPGVDPAFELSQTMAISNRMVLLVRVLAVFGFNALLGLVASVLSADAVGLTLGWLVPMTTIAALALAVATFSRSANTGLAAGLGVWSIIVLGSAYGMDNVAAAVESGALLPVYAIATVALAGVAVYGSSGRRMGGMQWW
jgi:hypothetical protein